MTIANTVHCAYRLCTPTNFLSMHLAARHEGFAHTQATILWTCSTALCQPRGEATGTGAALSVHFYAFHHHDQNAPEYQIGCEASCILQDSIVHHALPADLHVDSHLHCPITPSSLTPPSSVVECTGKGWWSACPAQLSQQSKLSWLLLGKPSG